MSFFKYNPAFNNLVKSSLGSKHELEWIPYEKICRIKPTQIDNVYYASHYYYGKIILIFLGNSEATFMSLPEYTRFQHTRTTMTLISSEDISTGVLLAT